MEALSSFLRGAPEDSKIMWEPRGTTALQDDSTAQQERLGVSDHVPEVTETKSKRARGRKASGTAGSKDIELILNLFQRGGAKALKLRDFRREFGGQDQTRLQKGIDPNDLDIMYRDVFNLIDRDGKGYLSMEDFMHIIYKRLSNTQIEEIEAVFRSERGGKEEVKKLPALADDKFEEMKELFGLYDIEGTGKLSLQIFEEAIAGTWAEKPTRQEIQQYFNDADNAGKGWISLSDFVNWLQKTLWVDFMDLSKGASHGYCKYNLSQNKMYKQRRQGFHANLGSSQYKTLLDITVGNKPNAKVSHEHKYAIQQSRSSRRRSAEAAISSNTLNQPIGPKWRPPKQEMAQRPRSTTSSMATSPSGSPAGRKTHELSFRRPLTALPQKSSAGLSKISSPLEMPPRPATAMSPQRTGSASSSRPLSPLRNAMRTGSSEASGLMVRLHSGGKGDVRKDAVLVEAVTIVPSHLAATGARIRSRIRG